MKELKVQEYKRFEDIKYIREDGSEYWSARELALTLDYTEWRNFSNVIGRAMIACENSGHSILNDFVEVNKIVEAGVTVKPKKDYELSRNVRQRMCVITQKNNIQKSIYRYNYNKGKAL